MTKPNYKAANYAVDIEVSKTPNEVFSNLVNLKKWWPEDFVGEDIKLGSEFIFTTGDSHYSKNKVSEFVPNKKLAWIVTESIRKTDNFDWSGTKMIFELTPKVNSTIVKFTYDGVVLENETDRLVKICDLTLKEIFYDFVVNGKGK